MNMRHTLLALLCSGLVLSGCGREAGEAHSHETESHQDDSHEKDSHEDESHEHDEHAEEPSSVPLPAAVAKEVGIVTAPVGPGTIRDAHEVQGLLTPVEGRHARIRARFPGVVRTVAVGVGDKVQAGQVLATIESNSSLSDYAVKAPFAGVILERSVTVGDLAADQPLFELADLTTLWVDLHLFGADAQHIVSGLPVKVVRMSDEVVATTKLDRILPGTATASQSTIARATIRNEDGRWRPGTAVRALVTVAENPADKVVPLSAIQTLDGRTVVFVRNTDTYTPRTVRLGERDADYARVLDGLELSEEIVVEQSYVLKADLEKAGVAHEH